MRQCRGAHKTLILFLRIGLREEEMFAHIGVTVCQLLLVCLLWGKLGPKCVISRTAIFLWHYDVLIRLVVLNLSMLPTVLSI